MSNDILHIYLRVSTTNQFEDGFGLESQLEEGKKVGKSLGLEIVEWNEEDASSSSEEITDRPILTQLMDLVEKGEVKNIYSFNFDRLSRNRITGAILRTKFEQFDINLYMGRNTTPHKMSDPETQLLMDMLGSISVYDNN